MSQHNFSRLAVWLEESVSQPCHLSLQTNSHSSWHTDGGTIFLLRCFIPLLSHISLCSSFCVWTYNVDWVLIIKNMCVLQTGASCMTDNYTDVCKKTKQNEGVSSKLVRHAPLCRVTLLKSASLNSCSFPSILCHPATLPGRGWGLRKASEANVQGQLHTDKALCMLLCSGFMLDWLSGF